MKKRPERQLAASEICRAKRWEGLTGAHVCHEFLNFVHLVQVRGLWDHIPFLGVSFLTQYEKRGWWDPTPSEDNITKNISIIT